MPMMHKGADSTLSPGRTCSLRYFLQPEGVTGSSTPYGNNLAIGSFIQAGDAHIYFEVHGSGRPFFVFHGGGLGCAYELGCVIDALRRDFQVVSVSTRGHGRSEIGFAPLTFEQKAEDMLAVMRSVTDEPAPVFGFSDGAYAALKLAAMYPEAVERVIAVGAGTLEPGFFPDSMDVADIEKMDAAFVAQQRSLMPEPERLQEFWNAYMHFWHNLHVGSELFQQVSCPVLLIVGDEDDHAPVASVLAAHQLLPCSRLAVIPKAWHTAFLDDFPAFWACMDRFVHADRKSLTPSRKIQQNSIC